MNKVHNDLGVAETLIYNLDSWLSKWDIETPHVHIDVPENSMVMEKAEYPIVYAKSYKEKHLPGTLTVSNKSLEFFNAETKLDICFAVKEVTEVSVHTPWEVTISQLRIGHVGRSVHLIAARLVHILQTLEVMLPGKINYDEPPYDAGDHDSYDMDSDRLPSQGKCCLTQTLRFKHKTIIEQLHRHKMYAKVELMHYRPFMLFSMKLHISLCTHCMPMVLHN